MAIVAIVFYIFLFAGYFFSALIYGVLGIIVQSIMRITLPFGAIYKLALYSMVTPHLLKAVNSLLPFNIPRITWLCRLITCLYLVLALNTAKISLPPASSQDRAVHGMEPILPEMFLMGMVTEMEILMGMGILMAEALLTETVILMVTVIHQVETLPMVMGNPYNGNAPYGNGTPYNGNVPYGNAPDSNGIPTVAMPLQQRKSLRRQCP